MELTSYDVSGGIWVKCRVCGHRHETKMTLPFYDPGMPAEPLLLEIMPCPKCVNAAAENLLGRYHDRIREVVETMNPRSMLNVFRQRDFDDAREAVSPRPVSVEAKLYE